MSLPTLKDPLIEEEQLQYQSFLKSHSLPNNYNTIESYADSWILLKKTNLPPKFSFPFKNILVVFGQDVDGKFKIHSIHYPKKDYDIENIRKIAKSTLKCRYCIEGENILIPYDISESYINPEVLKRNDDRNNDLEEKKNMFNKFKGVLKSEAVNAYVRPVDTFDNIFEAVNDTFVYPVNKVYGEPGPISFPDFISSSFFASLFNNFSAMQPTAGGQLLTGLVGVIGGPALSWTLGKIFKGEPKWINRMMKLVSANLVGSLVPNLIGGAKFDAGFLDQAVGDIQGAIQGIMGGYGLRAAVGELFDFGFNFNFGSYLPFVQEEGFQEITPDAGDLAKILL